MIYYLAMSYSVSLLRLPYRTTHESTHRIILMDSLKGLDRTQVVRLLEQSLKDLGYDSLSKRLQQESSIPLNEIEVDDFLALLAEHEFCAAEKAAGCLKLDPSDFLKVSFLLKKCYFFSLIDNGQRDEALNLLRTEISPLQNKLGWIEGELRDMALVLQKEASQDAASTLDVRWPSIDEIIQEVSRMVDPGRLFPPGRLVQLIKQAELHQQAVAPLGEVSVIEGADGTNTDEKVGKKPTINAYPILQDYCNHKLHYQCSYVLDDHKDEVWFVRFSHSGHYLCSTSSDQTVLVYKVGAPYKVCTILKGATKAIMYASWSPNDTKILTCSLDCHIRIYNANDGELINSMEFPNRTKVWTCEWIDNYQFVIGSPDKKLIILDQDFKTVYSWQAQHRVSDLCIARDPARVLTISHDHHVHIYDVASRRLEHTIRIGKRLTSITVSKDGSHFLLSISPDELQLWDMRRLVLVNKFYGQQQPNYVIRSCFGGLHDQLVLSGSEDGRVYVWNSQLGNLVTALAGHQGLVNCVDWCNGSFASAGDDKTVRIWTTAE